MSNVFGKGDALGDEPGIELEASLDDLKLVYRILHAHLAEHDELIDAPIFEELQTVLQRQAGAEGVDVTDHGAWAAWLRGEVRLSSVKSKSLLS